MKRGAEEIFYVLDTETTGIYANFADIIEIAVLKVMKESGNRFRILDKFDQYINPQYPLPKNTVAFNIKNKTGITDELLSKAPTADIAVRELRNFLQVQKPFIVGHNIISYDYRILNRTYYKYTGRDFRCRLFDTLLFAKKYQLYHNAENNRLETLFELSEKRHSKANPKFHTAIADCCANLDVLEYLLDIEEISYIPDWEREDRFLRCLKVK